MPRIEFKFSEPTPDIFIIDKRTMPKIRDRAHKLFMETKKPDANLIMMQAIYDEMVALGMVPNFKVMIE